MRAKFTIDSRDAGEICETCLDAAHSVGASVSVAVVDDAGQLLRFERMDRVRAHTVDFAMRKARSAAMTGVSTKLIDSAVRSGKLSNVDAIGGGGMPLIADGECVGAIGISGSSPEVDDEIAARAAAAFADRLSTMA